MSTRLIKSIGLILGTLGAFTVGGPLIGILIWIVLSGLFMVSRFSKRVVVFAEWSWLQFVVTMVCALGTFYVWVGIWMLYDTAF